MTLFLGAIALTLPPAVAGQDFTCPQNITITETAQSVPKDWHVVHDANPVRLFTVAMSYEDGFLSETTLIRNCPTAGRSIR
ncbi:MAG: STY0301 family protein, partial [Rhizomicrobium sp.]